MKFPRRTLLHLAAGAAALPKKLNKEINGALSDPTIKGCLADLGCNVFAGSPTDFGKFIADETEK